MKKSVEIADTDVMVKGRLNFNFELTLSFLFIVVANRYGGMLSLKNRSLPTCLICFPLVLFMACSSVHLKMC